MSLLHHHTLTHREPNSLFSSTHTKQASMYVLSCSYAHIYLYKIPYMCIHTHYCYSEPHFSSTHKLSKCLETHHYYYCYSEPYFSSPHTNYLKLRRHTHLSNHFYGKPRGLFEIFRVCDLNFYPIETSKNFTKKKHILTTSPLIVKDLFKEAKKNSENDKL